MGELPNTLQTVLAFLTELERKKIFFRLDRCREDTILIRVDVPGERWEVEFFADGTVEVERFYSSGSVVGGDKGQQLLRELLETFGD